MHLYSDNHLVNITLRLMIYLNIIVFDSDPTSGLPGSNSGIQNNADCGRGALHRNTASLPCCRRDHCTASNDFVM